MFLHMTLRSCYFTIVPSDMILEGGFIEGATSWHNACDLNPGGAGFESRPGH
jgi:hypothetical protein